MENKEKIIKYLRKAVAAFEKGKEDRIMACCKECSKNMNAAQKLDTTYAKVYQQFSDGGIESDCSIAKNRWCFAKQEFAKARIKDLLKDGK